LFKLSKQISHLNGSIIEVGVWRGGSAKILEKNLGLGNNLYLCDTFSGVVKAGVNDKVYKGGEHADTNLDEVKQLFHHNENVIILQGIFPEQTSHLIDSNSIKLCHIDVDVHDSAKDIFEWDSLN
jgi:O-methyltransferase